MIIKANSQPRRISLFICGVFALVIGFFLVTQPLALAKGLTWFYGFFILLSGLAMLSFRIFEKREMLAMVEGVTGMVVGALLMLYPDMAFNVAMIFITLWLFSIGLSQSLTGILLRHYSIGVVMFLSGIFSIGMAVLLLFNPVIPLLAIGYYLIVYGAVMLVLSIGTSAKEGTQKADPSPPSAG